MLVNSSDSSRLLHTRKGTLCSGIVHKWLIQGKHTQVSILTWASWCVWHSAAKSRACTTNSGWCFQISIIINGDVGLGTWANRVIQALLIGIRCLLTVGSRDRLCSESSGLTAREVGEDSECESKSTAAAWERPALIRQVEFGGQEVVGVLASTLSSSPRHLPCPPVPPPDPDPHLFFLTLIQYKPDRSSGLISSDPQYKCYPVWHTAGFLSSRIILNMI